jgi:hypothetical protein
MSNSRRNERLSVSLSIGAAAVVCVGAACGSTAPSCTDQSLADSTSLSLRITKDGYASQERDVTIVGPGSSLLDFQLLVNASQNAGTAR